MQSTTDTGILRCDNLAVSARGITETDRNKVVVFVPSEEIDHVELRFGRSAHHPLASLAMGAAFVAAGLWGLVHLMVAPAGFRYEAAAAALGMIGGAIVFDVLKQRYFFEIHRRNGIRRAVFSKNAEMQKIQEFCRQIMAVHKYQIRDLSGSQPSEHS